MLARRRARGALLALAACAVLLGACADEPKAAAPSGVSTATPAPATPTATASPTPTPLGPEQIRAMTAAQLEPLLTSALVQRGDIPPAAWRITEVSLRDPVAALKEGEGGDLTHNLGLINGECFVALPVGDGGAAGVMRVFSIATAAQGTTIVSAVFRVRGDAQAAIERSQAAANTPATVACLQRALGVTMTPQVPVGRVEILNAGGSVGMLAGVGSMEAVGRISGGGQVFSVSLASVTFAAGPLIAIVAEVAVVPRDETPVLPGRPLDLLQAGGLRLATAIGVP